MALYKLKRGTAKVLRCFSPRAIKNAMTRISSRFSKPTPVEGTITIHTIPPRATNSAISLSNTGTENTLSTTSTAVDLHDLVNWADFTGGTPRPDDAIHVCTQASMFAFSFRGGTPAQPAYFRATQKTQTFLHPSRGDREIIEVVYNLFQHQHLTWPQVFLILCVPNELLLRLSQANRDVVAAFMRRNYEILMSEELIRRFLHAPQFPSPVFDIYPRMLNRWKEQEQRDRGLVPVRAAYDDHDPRNASLEDLIDKARRADDGVPNTQYLPDKGP